LPPRVEPRFLDQCLGLGKVRVNTQRRRTVRDGLPYVSFAAICKAAVVIRGSIIGVKPDSLGIVRDSLVIVPFGSICNAAAVIRGGKIGVKPDRLGILRDGLVIPAASRAGAARRQRQRHYQQDHFFHDDAPLLYI
jgi:hypothetical protein